MKSPLIVFVILLVGCNAGICPEGYFYTETFGCRKNTGYCYGTFEDYIGCTDCIENTYLKDGTCETCDNCKYGHCLTNGTCSACTTYYASVNGTCQKMNHCKFNSYKDGIGCYDCYDGYFGPMCKDCRPHCYKWNGKEGCEMCYDGYFLEKGICYGCGEGCLSCKNETGCRQCNNSYVIFKKKSHPKDPNCLEYDLVNSTGCVQCKNGYFISEGGCINGLNCIDKVEGKYCISCEDGYELKNGICQQCPSHYFSYNNNCIYPSNCIESKNGTGCIYCEKNYQLVEIKPFFCMKCKERCLYCNSTENCIKCVDEYHPIDGKCYRCGDGCLSCFDIGNCTVCKDGYKKVGIRCQNVNCDINCLPGYCDENVSCSGCKDGYYAKNGKCVKCPEHCSYCYFGGICGSCNNGYYLAEDLTVCKKDFFFSICVGMLVFEVLTIFAVIGLAIFLVTSEERKIS